MKNQIYLGTPTSPRFALCPTSVTAGMPVLIGNEPAVALDDYQSNLGGTTFYMAGTYGLTVIGRSSESPVVTAGIKPGDRIYAVGTLDSATNVTTALTLDANSSTGTLFGYLDPQYNTAITAGTTNTYAGVKLAGSGS